MRIALPPWTRAWAFVFAVVTACFAAPSAAMANETRVSFGYRTVDLRTGHLGSSSDVDGKGYYIRAEGDEGDFLYGLSFGRHSASGTGEIPPNPPTIPNPLESDLNYPDIETVGAALGWHGLYHGGLGFGPFIAYEKVASSDSTLTFNERTLPIVEVMSREQAIAGVLMRAERDNFDFSATAGSIVMGDAWEHGLAMSLAVDIHVSDVVTLTGDWTRAWGEQAVWEGIIDDGDKPVHVNRETTADAFGLGGRLRIVDGIFLEGWMTRARNGTNIYFLQDNWTTTLNIGVGTTF